mmetsp:Transcript_20183/g.56789  ORF Transcript_20183/g.56789 Transcript_20183/m.56789 type:complete len:234 (+) Transcript_20183:664-1365(+)
MPWMPMRAWGTTRVTSTDWGATFRPGTMARICFGTVARGTRMVRGWMLMSWGTVTRATPRSRIAWRTRVASTFPTCFRRSFDRSISGGRKPPPSGPAARGASPLRWTTTSPSTLRQTRQIRQTLLGTLSTHPPSGAASSKCSWPLSCSPAPARPASRMTFPRPSSPYSARPSRAATWSLSERSRLALTAAWVTWEMRTFRTITMTWGGTSASPRSSSGKTRPLKRACPWTTPT